MLKPSIGRNVFATVLAIAALVTASTLLCVQLSIGQGFSRYLTVLELARLSPLVDQLAERYREHGGWTFLPKDASGFEHWLRLNFLQELRKRDRQFREPSPELSENSDVPPEPPDSPAAQGFPRWRDRGPRLAPPLLRGPRFMAMRLSVLDASRRVVAGRESDIAESRPIRIDGQVVGYLALIPLDVPSEAAEVHFLAGQTNNLWAIGLLAILVSGLGAWLLARYFINPVKRLVEGTHRLTAGDFGARLDLNRADEFGALARDFNQLAATLARNEETRRQWITDASHELRTPIAVLQSHIEAMQDGIRTVECKTLSVLHDEVINLARLVDDLQSIARADAGWADLELVEVDVGTLLEGRLERFITRLEQHGMTLEKCPEQFRGCLSFADVKRLGQVFDNLLENTLRYTDPGGRLRVTCMRVGHEVVVRFDDSAPGVPLHAMERLFDRFYRAEPSRSRRLGGSGLGLALCRTLIEQHGGSIVATPSDLGGLSVSITLSSRRK